jgi:hypothetical protein
MRDAGIWREFGEALRNRRRVKSCRNGQGKGTLVSSWLWGDDPVPAAGPDRRRHTRLHSATLQLEGNSAVLCDVSMGGACLLLPTPAELGQRLSLALRDAASQAVLALEAEVAWVAGSRVGLRWANPSSHELVWLRHRIHPWALGREVVLLFTICMLDTLSTVWLLQRGLAREANPLLAPFAEAGPAPFALAKFLTFGPTLVWAEFHSRKRPEFVLPLLRGAALLYLVIYFAATIPQMFR